jgi:hypothetical protein
VRAPAFPVDHKHRQKAAAGEGGQAGCSLEGLPKDDSKLDSLDEAVRSLV